MSDGEGTVVRLPLRAFRWITEAQGACSWCAVGLCEWCASTSAVPAPCVCCGPKEDA